MRGEDASWSALATRLALRRSLPAAASGSTDPAAPVAMGIGTLTCEEDLGESISALGFDTEADLSAGYVLDLTQQVNGRQWDLSDDLDQKRCTMLLETRQPLVLIGALFGKSLVKQAEYLASLYEKQVDGERYFLHAHPDNAMAVEVGAVAKLRQRAMCCEHQDG